MKKVLGLVSGLLIIFGVVGNASATKFTDTQILNVTLGEGTLAGLVLSDSYSYSHLTPADFQVPWDTVDSATLSISGYWIDGDDDPVYVQGAAVGTLNSGGSYGGGYSILWHWVNEWDTPSISTFDVASIFSSWTTGDSFDVTISANGDWGDGIIQLASSTLTLVYENGTQQNTNTQTETSTTPEPATILLFGVGMLGMAGLIRKKQ